MFVPVGMAALDSKASGKMGMRAVIYYMTTTVIAVFIGIIIVLIIHPGKGSKEEFGKQQTIEQVSPADAFLDLIRWTLKTICSKFNCDPQAAFPNPLWFVLFQKYVPTKPGPSVHTAGQSVLRVYPKLLRLPCNFLNLSDRKFTQRSVFFFQLSFIFV